MSQRKYLCSTENDDHTTESDEEPSITSSRRSGSSEDVVAREGEGVSSVGRGTTCSNNNSQAATPQNTVVPPASSKTIIVGGVILERAPASFNTPPQSYGGSGSLSSLSSPQPFAVPQRGGGVGGQLLLARGCTAPGLLTRVIPTVGNPSHQQVLPLPCFGAPSIFMPPRELGPSPIAGSGRSPNGKQLFTPMASNPGSNDGTTTLRRSSAGKASLGSHASTPSASHTTGYATHSHSHAYVDDGTGSGDMQSSQFVRSVTGGDSNNESTTSFSSWASHDEYADPPLGYVPSDTVSPGSCSSQNSPAFSLTGITPVLGGGQFALWSCNSSISTPMLSAGASTSPAGGYAGTVSMGVASTLSASSSLTGLVGVSWTSKGPSLQSGLSPEKVGPVTLRCVAPLAARESTTHPQ